MRDRERKKEMTDSKIMVFLTVEARSDSCYSAFLSLNSLSYLVSYQLSIQ